MKPLEYVQDRDEAIAAFDRLLDSSHPWIQAYTGFSGNGKATLLAWLVANRCISQNIPGCWKR